MPEPVASAIIVNYRTADAVSTAVTSVTAAELSVEIVVVDNSEDPAEAARLEELRQGVGERLRLVVNSANEGYGAAADRAVAEARGRWLLFINPDTELLPGALERLLAEGERSGARLVGPRIYLDSGRDFQQPPFLPHEARTLLAAWLAPKLFQRRWTTRSRRYWSEERSVRVRYLSGAAVLARSPWIGYDHRYFLYFEDEDACRRLRQRGGRILYCPTAAVVHHGELSPSEAKERHFADSQQRFLRLRYGRLGAPILLRAIAAARARRDPHALPLGPELDSLDGKRVQIGFHPSMVPFTEGVLHLDRLASYFERRAESLWYRAV
jgi:GT2 family glycosyltransferase